MDNVCDGVGECTALVLAESCAEVEDRLTLFGIPDEILLSDDSGKVPMESDEDSIWLEGTEVPVTIVASFSLPEGFGDGGERVLWMEAVDDDKLSQTALRLHDRYSV